MKFPRGLLRRTIDEARTITVPTLDFLILSVPPRWEQFRTFKISQKCRRRCSDHQFIPSATCRQRNRRGIQPAIQPRTQRSPIAVVANREESETGKRAAFTKLLTTQSIVYRCPSEASYVYGLKRCVRASIYNSTHDREIKGCGPIMNRASGRAETMARTRLCTRRTLYAQLLLTLCHNAFIPTTPSL